MRHCWVKPAFMMLELTFYGAKALAKPTENLFTPYLRGQLRHYFSPQINSAPAMIDNDDLDDDLLDDDDDLDTYAKKGGAASMGSSEDRLSAKYADYLMWTDTGSSHDEALDLANMTEEEFVEAERAENSDRGGFTSLDDDDDDFADDDDEEDEGYSSGRGSRRGSSFDSDDY